MSTFHPGSVWLPALVHHVHSRGVDAIVGAGGCWYFPFEEVKAT